MSVTRCCSQFTFFLTDVRDFAVPIVLIYQLLYLLIHGGNYGFFFATLACSIDIWLMAQAKISLNAYVPSLPFIRTVTKEEDLAKAKAFNIAILATFFGNYLITVVPVIVYGLTILLSIVTMVVCSSLEGPNELQITSVFVAVYTMLALFMIMCYSNKHPDWPQWSKGMDWLYYKRSTDISVWIQPKFH